MPEFSQVVDILIDDNGVAYFALQKMSETNHSKHYHAYTVDYSTTSNVFIGKQEEFIDYHSYYTHQTFNAQQRSQHYIVLKYYIGV